MKELIAWIERCERGEKKDGTDSRLAQAWREGRFCLRQRNELLKVLRDLDRNYELDTAVQARVTQAIELVSSKDSRKDGQ